MTISDGDNGAGVSGHILQAPQDEPSFWPPQDCAAMILESESFLWLMVGSNHTEHHLECLRPIWREYIAAGGKTWGKGQHGD
jgi:hypothetical protein